MQVSKQTYQVWEPENMEESDAITVEDFNPEWAASEAMEKINDNADHEYTENLLHSGVVVHVKDATGKVHKVRVTGSYDISYHSESEDDE